PRSGSFILASNHASYVDPQILGLSVWRRFSYVAKEELFRNKFLAFWLYQVGAFPIKRDSSDFGALRETLRRLKKGCPVVVFPQGTRKTSLSPQEVLPGVGFIAGKSRCPVLPAYIGGSDNVLPPGTKWFRRGHVKVKIGPPINFPPNTSYESMARQIMETIVSLSRQR
ncbi:MAG: lysophospholipid acyltransferase family protein, partial [Candidatus Omnitrophota bacterium]|nr:lysophospholipid acyltransferase family protein [Candidatus Omnitrophota bacterium]